MPAIHQFLGHNGFPPQPSAGNVYLPPPPPPPSAPTATGVKYSLPHFKAGANGGNPTQYGIQSGGPFINTPGGYAPVSTVTSGSSVGNEDLGASQMKENHIYTTGQLVGLDSIPLIEVLFPCMNKQSFEPVRGVI